MLISDNDDASKQRHHRPCYCAIIQEKNTKVINNFLTHTATTTTPLDNHHEEGGGGGFPFTQLHHTCHLKATHSLEGYFEKKILAPQGSKEEANLSTFKMVKSMNHVIDSLSIESFQQEYYAIEMARLLPSMFNLHQLAVCCNRMKKGDFNRWYNDRVYYNDKRKSISIEEALIRDNTFIYREEEPRETITITDVKKNACLEVTLENFVFSTECENENTGEDYAFNLSYIAMKLLPCGVSLTKTKFAKIDMRTLWGSQLIFRDGKIIETGAKKAEISAKLRQHTINKLKYECVYKNLGIRSSKIENVVVTAKTNFNILLHLLKHKYPFVTYLPGPDSFSGAIIRMRDVDDYMTKMGLMNAFIDYEDEDENDEYEIKESSFKKKKRLRMEAQGPIIKLEEGGGGGGDDELIKVKREENSNDNRGMVDEDEEEDEDDDDCVFLDDDDDATVIKVKIEDRPYGSGGGGGGGGGGNYNDDDGVNVIDREYNENMEAYVKYIESTTKNKNSNGNGNEKTKDNATTLTFFRGASISVGYKSRKAVKISTAKLLYIYESVRDSPENIEQEKRLLSNHSLASTTVGASTSTTASGNARKRRQSTQKAPNAKKIKVSTVINKL
jgi:TATA-box binding protein (TBP) (component of TFIID and TFIIIB)